MRMREWSPYKHMGYLLSNLYFLQSIAVSPSSGKKTSSALNTWVNEGLWMGILQSLAMRCSCLRIILSNTVLQHDQQSGYLITEPS